MQTVKTTRSMKPTNWNKNWLYAIILIALIGIGLFIINAVWGSQPASLPQESAGAIISQADLETQHGIHVNLIAVTAAGGLVDVRLKILDADKARQLWGTDPNYPALKVTDSGTILAPVQDTRAQVASLEDGGVIFLVYPNSSNVVKPGTQISLMFPEAQVEPIPSQ